MTEPAVANRLEASLRRLAFRPVIATFAPSSMNASAVAKPIPEEPPVMRATCPSSDRIRAGIVHSAIRSMHHLVQVLATEIIMIPEL